MILTQVHNEIPVWEVTDFDLPHVDWTDSGHLDQGNNNPVKQLRRHCAIDPHNKSHADFTSSWDNHIAYLENYLSDLQQTTEKKITNIRFIPSSESYSYIKKLKNLF